jgi:hypothetical protein
MEKSTISALIIAGATVLGGVFQALVLRAAKRRKHQGQEASASRAQLLLAPHRMAVMVAWIVVTTIVVLMLLHNVRFTDRYNSIRYLLHVCYVASLLWYLSRTGASVKRLPELIPQLLPRWRYGAWVPVLGIVILLALTIVSDDGLDILILLLIVATVWLLLAGRREIRLRAVIQGLSVALIAYLAIFPAVRNGFFQESTRLLLSILTAPMYVAGGLLLERTRLGGNQLLAGRYAGALRSLFWGALLFVPLGLLNAADGSPGSGITWVSEWWMPFSLPWFSGIAEETLFRFLLVSLCFFLLRPAFRRHPAIAVIAALLFSGTVFGLGHGRTLERFLTTGLLYGVPMAAVFAKRDWEHAVGAHYMVNMIPWLMVFLET